MHANEQAESHLFLDIHKVFLHTYLSHEHMIRTHMEVCICVHSCP